MIGRLLCALGLHRWDAVGSCGLPKHACSRCGSDVSPSCRWVRPPINQFLTPEDAAWVGRIQKQEHDR